MIRAIAAFLVTLVIGVIVGIVDCEVVVRGAPYSNLSYEAAIVFLALLLSLLVVFVCMVNSLLVQVIDRPNLGKTIGLLVGLFSGILFFVFWLNLPEYSILIGLGVLLLNLGVYYVVGIITQAIVAYQPTFLPPTTRGQGNES